MVHVILSLWCTCVIVEPRRCGYGSCHIFTVVCSFNRRTLEVWIWFMYLCCTFIVGICSVTLEFGFILCLNFTAEACITCNPKTGIFMSHFRYRVSE